MEFWVKYARFVANIGSSGNAGEPRFYTQLTNSAGGLRTAIGSWFGESTTLGKTNEWYMLTFVFDKGAIYTYVNDELRHTETGVTFTGTSASPFSSGRGFSYERYHEGSIDDVIIYKRALSGDEVKLKYNLEIRR